MIKLCTSDEGLLRKMEFLLQKEFENLVFKKESFVNQDLKHKIFSHVIFDQCDFSQSDLTLAKFLECKFLGCNLSLSKIDGTRFQEVEFEGCKLVGLHFSKCEQTFLRMQFKKSLISTCNFSDLDLKNTVFQQCQIRDTYFTNVNLTGSDFSKSDLQGSTFHQTNLTKANFVGAINYSISPLVNKLTKAKFSSPEVLSLLSFLDIAIES